MSSLSCDSSYCFQNMCPPLAVETAHCRLLRQLPRHPLRNHTTAARTRAVMPVSRDQLMPRLCHRSTPILIARIRGSELVKRPLKNWPRRQLSPYRQREASAPQAGNLDSNLSGPSPFSWTSTMLRRNECGTLQRHTHTRVSRFSAPLAASTAARAPCNNLPIGTAGGQSPLGFCKLSTPIIGRLA